MTAIVPAAGCGVRTGLKSNKVLAPIAGRPLLSWTLQALVAAAPSLSTLGIKLNQILIAAREEEFDLLFPLAAVYSPLVKIVAGGATRQESVGNAAQKANADFLLIHDAARPLLSVDLILRVTQAALKTGAAIAALPASDTIKIARRENGVALVGSTPDRATVWLAQTPQVFQRELYLRALKNAIDENFEGTDCASLLEQIGENVALVCGEAENFKVTFADDLIRAESILKARFAALQNAVN